MKNKLNGFFQALLLVSFISILVIDHFETMNVPLTIPLISIVICIVANVATADVSKQIEPRTKLIRNVGFTIIFIVALYVLDLLGGVSESGIGFYSPLVWLLVILSITFNFITYNKTVKTTK